MSSPDEVIHHLFRDAQSIPNNPSLPLVVYKAAFRGKSGEDLAKQMEERFEQHGWPPAWRWGVYDYPHYHSTAHEVLGVYRGMAKIKLGHDTGAVFEVTAGDVIVVPAGVGHQNVGSSDDFHVVGAYPERQKADLLRGDAGERPAADQRIARVPLPSSDPVSHGGVLTELWKLK